jgi:hypothetical protein
MTISVSVQPLPIFNEHKQVVTDTHYLNVLEIMNRDKHIWEGWTVGDFIDDIEPIFDECAPFMDKHSLKHWVAQEQPYYKKHIPEVYEYFLKKSGL